MAAVIFSTIFFLATVPMPGGASIRQTGTTPSLHVRALPLSPNRGAARGSRALRYWDGEIRCPFVESLCGSSGRCVYLHFFRPGRVANPSVSGGDRLLRSLDPPNLGLKR